MIGASYGTAAKLIKFDKYYNEVFNQDYKKLLKGYEFKSIQFLKKDMFLFAHAYNKKEKNFTISGVKLDRKTGEPMGEMQELANFQLEDKKDDFEFSFTPTPDSTTWMLVGNISTDVRSTIVIQTFDEKLKKKGAASRINLSFAPNTFDLEDVLQTVDGKYLLMGQKFEMVPTGKKNKTTRTFSHYIFTKYDNKGKKEMELPVDMQSKYVTSAKAIYFPNGELLLSGFYSKEPKKKEVNGVYINRINVNSGSVISSAFKEINANMLDQGVDDEDGMDEDDKKARREREKAREKDGGEDGIMKDFIIRGIEFNQQSNTLVILAEISKFREWTSTTSSHSPRWGWTYTTTFTYEFTNSDLIVIKADGQGQVAWINTLPKNQVEMIRKSSSAGGGLSFSSSGVTGFFARGGGMPFYSSFSYLLSGEKLVFLINDHPKNIEVLKLGDKVKTINNFNKSVAFAVSLDLNTAKFSRKLLLSNNDEPVLMPRFAYVVGKEFFLPAMKMKALGKTQFKIGKVAVKSM